MASIDEPTLEKLPERRLIGRRKQIGPAVGMEFLNAEAQTNQCSEVFRRRRTNENARRGMHTRGYRGRNAS
jgi:hypothetical protein